MDWELPVNTAPEKGFGFIECPELFEKPKWTLLICFGDTGTSVRTAGGLVHKVE